MFTAKRQSNSLVSIYFIFSMDELSEDPNELIDRETSKNRQHELFAFKLELLKTEIELVTRNIERVDSNSQTFKNWTVVTWAGSLALALQTPDLRDFVILTASIPLAFWFIDSWYRRNLRRFIYRLYQISSFLNDARLANSFRRQDIVNFQILDPFGRTHKETPEFKEKITLTGTALYPGISVLYLSLTAISLCLGIFFLVRP